VASLRARPEMQFPTERFALLRRAGGNQGFHTGGKNHNLLFSVAGNTQRLSLRGMLRVRVQASAPEDGEDAGCYLFQRLARLLIEVEELASLFAQSLRGDALRLLCDNLNAGRAEIASAQRVLRSAAPLPLLPVDSEWCSWFERLCGTLGYTRTSVYAAAAAEWVERPDGGARTGAAAAIRVFLHGAVGTMILYLRGESDNATSASLAAAVAPACAQYLLDCDTQKHVVEHGGNPFRRNDPDLVAKSAKLQPAGDVSAAVFTSFMRVLCMLPISTTRSELNRRRPSSARSAAEYYSETLILWEKVRRGAMEGGPASVRSTMSVTEHAHGQNSLLLVSLTGSATSPPQAANVAVEGSSSVDNAYPESLFPADADAVVVDVADSTDTHELCVRETAYPWWSTAEESAASRLSIPSGRPSSLLWEIGHPFRIAGDPCECGPSTEAPSDMPAASVHDHFAETVGCLPLEGDVERAFRLPTRGAATLFRTFTR